MLFSRRLPALSVIALLCVCTSGALAETWLPSLDPTRVTAYTIVGGADARDADYTVFTYFSDSPPVLPYGNPSGQDPTSSPDHSNGFLGGEPPFTFQLPKFDKVGLAASLGKTVDDIRLEEVIIDLAVKAYGGFNMLDNESPDPGLPGSALLTLGVQVQVRSLNVAQQVTMYAAPVVAETNLFVIAADDPADPLEALVPPVTRFGVTTNADFAGPDTFRIELNDVIRAAAETSVARTSGTPDDSELVDFMGTGTLLWEALSTKLASSTASQPNLASRTWNESPNFQLESRVVYIYTVAPEPATLAILGVGAAGMLWRRRRSRAAS